MKFTIFLFAFCLLTSCNALKKAKNDDDIVTVDIDFEERDLDTLFVEAPPIFNPNNFSIPQYQATRTRRNDLLHTKLAVRFDWAKQYLFGQATLSFNPYFYNSSELLLDAKGFDIHRVAIIKGTDSLDLKYQYSGEQLLIDLNESFAKTQTYTIFIDYTAKPNERETSGSAAITSDKGLYFINPLGEIAGKPRQIWTQGETEASSAWFPTIDSPNERCTQEIYITIDRQFKTLSNGILKSSTNNSDSTRTDYWQMDKPHAPYLFMMAIGEFSVITEQWDGKDVSYYVEPKYAEHAKAIFSNTIEMLGFFSEKLGVTYPWSKYAQVVVRDYVSGAMENTTGVIFGDFVQKTTRELIDDDNERIVAHELIHHWFGDLVTCESWSNLSLNESFANYGEYLWFEYKYGKEAADFHLLNELRGYLYTEERALHDLINFKYDEKEDMFDAHSYNKGGCILHMLRNYVGDEAFFASLNLYLVRYAHQSTEAHQLRLIFEEVTGEDLNWFFNQWYFATGHPQLDVRYGYDTAAQKAIVTVEQIQNPKYHLPIYQLPLALEVYCEGQPVVRQDIFITKRKETFFVDAKTPPLLMNLDADHVLVGTIVDNKNAGNYIYQLENAPLFLDRYEALLNLTSVKTPATEQVKKNALDDNFWVIRNQAVSSVTIDSSVLPKLRELLFDEHSQVRIASLNKLRNIGDPLLVGILLEAFAKNEELAYPVISARLDALYDLDPKAALGIANDLKTEKYPRIVNAVAQIFAESHDLKYLDFFYQNAVDIEGFYASAFFRVYNELLIQADESTIYKHAQLITTIAQEDPYNWKRFNAAKVIKSTSDSLRSQGKFESLTVKLDQMIAIIKSEETSVRIKDLYRGW